MDQTQTPRHVSRFEPLLYVPAFTQKDFYYMSTQDLPYRKPPPRIWQIQTRSTQLLSPTKSPLHKRQGTTTITSHKRNKALSQTTTITSTLREIPTNPNHLHNHLYPRGIPTKKRRLQLLMISKSTN